MREEYDLRNSDDPCPDDDNLRSYQLGELEDTAYRDAIKCHLEFCPTCRSRLKILQTSEENIENAVLLYTHRLRQGQGQAVVEKWRGPEPGTIWRTIPQPQSEEELFGPLVFVINKLDDGRLTVAEVSEDITQAVETDAILEPQESGFSFRCMIRSGNRFETSPEYLETFGGRMQPLTARRVITFCSDDRDRDEDLPLSEYVFGQYANGMKWMRRTGITSGVPATGDQDPRLTSLESSRRNCRYLISPEATWDMVAGTDAAAADTAVAPTAPIGRHANAVSIPRATLRYLARIAAVLVIVLATAKTTQLMIMQGGGPVGSESHITESNLKRLMALVSRAGLDHEGSWSPNNNPVQPVAGTPRGMYPYENTDRSSQLKQIRELDEMVVGTERVKVFGRYLEVGPLATSALLQRMNISVGNNFPVVVKAPSNSTISLEYAFYRTGNLSNDVSYKTTWRIDSLLIPAEEPDLGSGGKKTASPPYAMSSECLIGLALKQAPEELSRAFTMATTQWALRYCGVQNLPSPRELALLFKQRHKDLWEEIVKKMSEAGYREDIPGFWELLVSEIVARHLSESTSIKVFNKDLSLSFPFANIMMNTLMAMECFSTLGEADFFQDDTQVSTMYNSTVKVLRAALKSVFGDDFDYVRQLMVRNEARRLLLEENTIHSFQAGRPRGVAEITWSHNQSKWLTLQRPPQPLLWTRKTKEEKHAEESK